MMGQYWGMHPETGDAWVSSWKQRRAGMDERWTGNLFQKSEAADEKDFDFAIVVLRDGTHIVKEEDDRSDRNGV